MLWTLILNINSCFYIIVPEWAFTPMSIPVCLYLHQKLLFFYSSHLFSRTVSQWASWGRSVGRPSQLMHRPEVINVILRPNVPHRCRHWPAKTNNTYVPWGSSRDSLEKVKPDMKSVKRKVFVFTPEELWKLTQKFTFTILVLF